MNKNIDKVPLGQVLIQQGIIDSKQLEAALIEQKKNGQLLGLTLIRLGFLTEDQLLLPLMAIQLGVEYVNLPQLTPQPEALNRLPAKAANHYKVFPIKLNKGELTVAMHNPLDVHLIDDLGLLAKAKIVPVLAGHVEIAEAIRNFYGVGADTIEKMMSDGQMVTDKITTIETIDESSSEASISKFLNQILLQAHRDKATDIHIEPFEDELRIRYRIDGVLYDAKVPENIRYFQDALISRIKILSNLNIAERRLPQDGRFKVKVETTDLDLRVSFLPTPAGESCVIRLLNAVKLYSFQELGIVGDERKHLDELLNKPHGIMFLTGPTGSGKTTTLYSCLSVVNKEDTKIITVEDPIEYQLKGVVQIQANSQIGLTFAAALRSILRNDPDIIMVGEVRDTETAQIAIQMALTGHLVFSTLHTNDAASGVTRLIDMGVEPYLIASSVECFIAQRLVRLLCPHCKVPAVMTDGLRREFGINQTAVVPTIYESVGCKECRMTGFVGREAICEFLPMHDDIRALIINRSTAAQIKHQAILGGMKTLRRQGWEKVISGITSPSEVLRLTHED